MADQTAADEEELIAAIRGTDAHDDVAEYVRLASEQGGTPILGSMQHFHENSSVERIGEIGTRIEQTLWNEGAVATLELGHLDDTNREILEQIAPEGF